MLVFESQLVGRLVSELVPSPFGPLQPGQFCACASGKRFIIANKKVKLSSFNMVIRDSF